MKADGGGYVDVREGDTHVTVVLWSGSSTSVAQNTGMTPDEARYLARALLRCARRVEERKDQ